MHKSLLSGALLSCTFGLVCTPIQAQNATAQNAPTQNATAQNVSEKSGYDLFLEARALLKAAGPNGEPSAAEKLSPAENLRRQRLAVARNAPALAKLREALKAGIDAPPDSVADVSGGFVNYAVQREMARQLYQEAAVRAADGNAMGAAQSSLDTFQLGVEVSRGSMIQDLVGAAITAIARKSFEQHAALLNAAQSREVAQKWQQISDEMPTIAEVLRDEEKSQIVFVRQNLAEINDPQKRAQVQAELDKGTMDEADAQMMRQMLTLSLPEIEADYHALFDQAIARAALPYAVALKAEPLQGTNPLTNMSADLLNSSTLRFLTERDIVSNRELIAALRLRAAKLESGQYPETFDAGADPFSPDLSPLKYKRAGDSYVLYSVGPDGKDDNGAEIQTIITNGETGAKTVSDRLMLNSTGDIVAPVL